MNSPELSDNNFILGSPEYVLPTATQIEQAENPEEIDINILRNERGILENLHERFDNLIQEKGWKQVTEISETSKYPDIDQWVNSRIRQERGTKFYPCFVTTGEGDVRFLKVQVGKDENALNGLREESNILSKNILPIPAPKLIELGEASDTGLAYICLEAIKFEDGRVGSAAEWHPTHAINAAEQVRLMERQNLDNLPPDIESLPQFQREIRITDRMVGMVNRSGEQLPAEVANGIREFASKGEISEVMVHGDLKLKNIIMNRTGTVSIIDWEMAGKGFMGQDAGKLMNNLESNPVVKNAFFEAYTRPDGKNYDSERLRGIYAGIIAENLVDITWRVENNPNADKNDLSDKAKAEINAYTSSIRTALNEYRMYSEEAVMDAYRQPQPVVAIA